MTVKIKTKKKKKPYCCYLRELMRDPPDKTTEKAPLSLQNLSDSCAVYLARATARSSADSNTSFFISPLVAIDTLVLLLLLILQQWLNLLSLTKERDKPLSLSVEALTSKGLCDALGEIMGTWNNRTEVVEMESLVWRVKGRAIHFL